jgi:hypothetical protein
MIDGMVDHLSVGIHGVPCGSTDLPKTLNLLSTGIYDQKVVGSSPAERANERPANSGQMYDFRSVGENLWQQ